LGNSGTTADNDKVGVMNTLINGGAGVSGFASINKATTTYDGKSIAANDVFQMDINGTKVNVKIGTAINGGSDSMDTVRGILETAIQSAVGTWNTSNGLTAGTYDTKSGLTGLTTTDFTVAVGDNGNFVITYAGDEDVSFSFSDVGDRTFAKSLGLASGSSLSGGATGLQLQIGDSSDSYNQLNVSVKDMHVNAMGISGINIGTQSGAQAAVDVIKRAINYVSDVRGNLGAISNRLDHTSNNLGVMRENIQDAESSIRDTDVADEMMAYTKNNILVQSAQAMLAQANQVPQGVLQLLQ